MPNRKTKPSGLEGVLESYPKPLLPLGCDAVIEILYVSVSFTLIIIMTSMSHRYSEN